MTTQIFPDFDAMWNFGDPLATEKEFRRILEENKTADAACRAELLSQIARTLGLQRKFAEGHQILDQAKALLNAEAKKASIRIALERGRLFNSSGQPEASREHFMQALDLALQAHEDNLAVDAAHMMGIVTKNQESIDWNEKAIRMAKESLDPKAQKWAGSLLNNLGWTYFDQATYPKAFDCFEQSAVAFQNNAESLRIANWAMARTRRALGQFTEALAEQKRQFEALQKESRTDGYVLEEIAENLLALGDKDSGHWFHLAHQELSQDPWLLKNEAPRIERLKNLAGKAGV